MPRSPTLATAIAVIANKTKLLVCENPEGILVLPGFNIASKDTALQDLKALIEKLNVDQQPQQTLYLNQLPTREARQKPVSVLVRIVHVEKAKTPSFLDGHFALLSKLRMQKQASPLVQIVARWMHDQWTG